jgi:hypothetical protein
MHIKVKISLYLKKIKISALGRQRQVDLCKFKAALYRVSSRTARVTQRNLVSKKKKKKKTKPNKQKQNNHGIFREGKLTQSTMKLSFELREMRHPNNEDHECSECQ